MTRESKPHRFCFEMRALLVIHHSSKTSETKGKMMVFSNRTASRQRCQTYPAHPLDAPLC